MTEVILLAWGLAGGADVRLLVLAAGAMWMPVPTGLATGVVVLAGKRAESRLAAGREIRFVETVAGELRSGASLRRGLRAALAGLGECEAMVRLLDLGRPLPSCLGELGQRLPTVGGLVTAAVSAGSGGGRMLPVFEELIAHAAVEDQAAAELRAATAQVRASMTVLIGGPVAYLAWSAWSGRLMRLLSLPGGGTVAALGSALFLVGVTVMVVMARRGR